MNHLTNTAADIVFLQETHLTKDAIPFFDTLWSGKCYHSYRSSNSRGTSILIRQALSHDLISEHYGNDGNYVLIVIKANNNILTLMNIYGPNDDTPSFYKHIDSLLQEVSLENIIVGGDFNFVMDRFRDSNYQHDNNIYAKKEFINIASKHNLVDIWRTLHPNEKEYTWAKRNPLKYGRLDMFFASEHLLTHVKEAKIQAGYRTDHNQILLTLEAFNQQKGPGLWKFNESLLQEENYTTLIKQLIIDAVEQYSVPIYSREFISNPVNFEEVDFKINISLFYEPC